MKNEKKHTGGRKRTGQLVCRPLGITLPGRTGEALARRKLDALLAAGAPTEPEITARAETFPQAAERVHEMRLSAGIANAKDEISSLRAYAFAELPMEVTA